MAQPGILNLLPRHLAKAGAQGPQYCRPPADAEAPRSCNPGLLAANLGSSAWAAGGTGPRGRPGNSAAAAPPAAGSQPCTGCGRASAVRWADTSRPLGGGGGAVRSLGVSLPPGALGPPPPPPRLEPGLVPPPAVGGEEPRLARHQTGAGCVDQTRFSEVTLQSRRRAGVAREWLRFLGIVTTLGHLNQSKDDPLQNFRNARACTAQCNSNSA